MKWIARWFWAPVRDGENWAQTLVRVSGNLLRSFTTIVLLGAAIISVSIYLQGQEDRHDAQESQEYDRRVGQLITVSVTTRSAGESSNGCSERSPLAITVRNDSALTLMEMDIELNARLRGTSTNILDYLDRRVRWDHIVPPKHMLGMCYRPGRHTVTPSAIYSARPMIESVVLRQTEDWMLSETRAERIVEPAAPGR